VSGQLTGWGLSEAIGLVDGSAPLSTASSPPSKAVRPRDARADDFDRLVADFQEPVTRLARRLLGWQRDDIEDIVHDVFLAALTNRHRFRKDASAWTWLAAITINRCRSHRRRQLVRLRWWRATMPTAELANDQASSVERDETAVRVRDAVGALPAKDREIVVLYYLEEMTVAQVAAVVGASAGAVEVRLHRARAKLRQLLGDAGLE